MTREEAVAECRRWLEHCDKMRARTKALGEIAGKVRRGEMTPDEGRREQYRVSPPGHTIFDSGLLEPSIRLLVAKEPRP